MIACSRRTPPISILPGEDGFEEALARFREYRLEPARVAPPTVNRSGGVKSVGELEGTATLVLVEDEPWNQWEGGPRLVNNTAAHWFRIDVRSVDGNPLRWLPRETRLELNEPGNILSPARNQEEVLEELLFFAYQQERHLTDGDLVQRLRGSGQLRTAYIADRGSHLQGLVAFPLPLNPDEGSFLGQGPPADYHVVSMRLTLAVRSSAGTTRMVWMFD